IVEQNEQGNRQGLVGNEKRDQYRAEQCAPSREFELCERIGDRRAGDDLASEDAPADDHTVGKETQHRRRFEYAPVILDRIEVVRPELKGDVEDLRWWLEREAQHPNEWHQHERRRRQKKNVTAENDGDRTAPRHV